MLYDVVAGTELNLGAGSLGHFSPDGTKMAWIANPQPPFGDGQAMLIEIATGAKRDLGPGGVVGFVDDNHVGVWRPAVAGSGTRVSESIDLTTGAVAPTVGCFPQCHILSTPEGYLILDKDAGVTSVTDPTTNRVVLRFTASNVEPAGGKSVLVATTMTDHQRDANGRELGTTNLFLVDIATGRATFVATTTYDTTYAANDAYVAWTDGLCALDGSHTRIFNRTKGTITELDTPLAPSFTPDGLILDGFFGGSALIDPATPQYIAAIPSRGDSSWSRDYHHASLGQFGGHDGPCL